MNGATSGTLLQLQVEFTLSQEVLYLPFPGVKYHPAIFRVTIVTFRGYTFKDVRK